MSLSKPKRTSTLSDCWGEAYRKRARHEGSLLFCLACIKGKEYHHGHFQGCPHGRKKGAFTETEIQAQLNAAARFYSDHRHAKTMGQIKDMKWFADLEAKVLKANTRRGMGPSCPQCFRKTTRGVCDPWSKHGDRAFYKCQPCDKFVQWAEPPKKEDVVEHIGHDDHLFFIPPTIACAEQPDENAPGNDSDIIDLTSP